MPEKRRVLIVDDDREIVRGLTIRLRAAGHEVRCAYDGAAGLAAAIAERPGVIVLDIRMPGLDGFAVLAKLRERAETHGIPVIVLSANGVESVRARALELGARHFLVKPYQAATLLAMIESMISQPSVAGGPPP